ncbi:MAG: hypothetical protein QOJ12_582 [Thermoleophilales bacterium]|nr:hypothetical protein [Thermoleophilales bacterium]
MRIASTTLVCCALVAGGCGGSDEPKPPQPAASTRTTTATPQPPAPPAKPKTSRTVAPKQKRLEKAGYDVIVTRTAGVEPPPEGALEFPLKGGGQITVFVYAKPADAQTKGAEFEKLAKQYPDRAKVTVVGATAYVGTAEVPEKLDRAAFDKAVARAESK